MKNVIDWVFKSREKIVQIRSETLNQANSEGQEADVMVLQKKTCARKRQREAAECLVTRRAFINQWHKWHGYHCQWNRYRSYRILCSKGKKIKLERL